MLAADDPVVLERVRAVFDLPDIIARAVRRTIGPNVEVDDLVGFGREGLLEAARRFEPERGVPFRAYASFRVRGAVLDGVRAMAHMPRRAHERLRALGMSWGVSEGAAEGVLAGGAGGSDRASAERALSEHLAAMATAMAVGLVATATRGEEGELALVEPGESPEEATSKAELLAIVRRAIEDLPHQQAELVRRHYLGGERFDHVAKELGLSKSWASRLHTRAVRTLTDRLRADG